MCLAVVHCGKISQIIQPEQLEFVAFGRKTSPPNRLHGSFSAYVSLNLINVKYQFDHNLLQAINLITLK